MASHRIVAAKNHALSSTCSFMRKSLPAPDLPARPALLALGLFSLALSFVLPARADNLLIGRGGNGGIGAIYQGAYYGGGGGGGIGGGGGGVGFQVGSNGGGYILGLGGEGGYVEEAGGGAMGGAGGSLPVYGGTGGAAGVAADGRGADGSGQGAGAGSLLGGMAGNGGGGGGRIVNMNGTDISGKTPGAGGGDNAASVITSSNLSYDYVGIGGGGGGGGYVADGASGAEGMLTVSTDMFTVNQAMLIGGGGGGGGGYSYGGDGGNGTVYVDAGATLSIGSALIIGGIDAGQGSHGWGGHGGTGILNLSGSLSMGSGASLTITNRGTLNIGNATPDAAVGGTLNATAITNNGSINFNQTTDRYNLSAAISGTGSITHNSVIYSYLTGVNSFSGGTTINAGGLIGNTSAFGSGSIVDNGQLIFEQYSDGTFSGSISGNGTLTKTGTRTAILSGDSSAFAGYVMGTEGSLLVSGKLGSSFARITSIGAAADITIAGSNARWDITGALKVKSSVAPASLIIYNGGKVTSNVGIIGEDTDHTGMAMLNNANSNWTIANELIIGDTGGTGGMQIRDGASVSNVNGFVGRVHGSRGGVLVTDPGSSWTSTGTLYLGLAPGIGDARGTMTVANGGKVNSNMAELASGGIGNVAIVQVTGSNSLWSNSNSFNAGAWGNASINIDRGGTLRIGANGDGNVNLAVNSTLPVGSATLTIGSTAGNPALAAGLLQAGSVTFGEGTATLNFNHTDSSYYFDAALVSGSSGNHALNQIAGTTILSADNSGFSGHTTVSGGVLVIEDKLFGIASVTGGRLQFGNGALADDSSLSGNLTVSGSTSILEVTAPASVTVAGNVSLGSATTLALFAGGNHALINAETMTIASGTTFNLFGISAASSGDQILISTVNGIGGDFDQINIGGFSGTVDYMTVNTRKSADSKQYLASYDLSWTANNDLAHGTFTLNNSGDSFEVGTALSDQNANAALGWDGKALTKAGAGTLVLSADNSFSGGTTIAAGTLQLGNGGNTGSVTGNIVNEGTLIINHSGTFTLGNEISGAGSFIQAGPGTTILSGSNSYAGGTQINSGILQVAADAALGAASGALTFNGGGLTTTTGFDTARSVQLAQNGSIRVASGAELGLTGAISGPGNLVKQGDGTLRLDNAGNAYGNTTVEQGRLIGTAASIRGQIANAGIVLFDQASDGTFAGSIAGYNGQNGRMTKDGSGNLTLTGTSSLDWTIDGGTLTASAEAFAGNAMISSNGTLQFDQAANARYAGRLSGDGAFSKSGGGKLLYDGDGSAFTGTTSIDGGALIVGSEASHASALLGGSFAVASGATLGGHGTIGSSSGSLVTIASGGILSPGNSIGTLTVNGDLTMQSGSIYQVEVDPAGTASDLTHVTGRATLTGASVLHMGESGVYKPQSTYRILAADSGVNGQFTGVNSNFAFLDPTLVYSANAVDLTLQRNDVGFADKALTDNQRATATALDSLATSGGSLYAAVVSLRNDPTAIRASFDALSGEAHASAKGVLINDSQYVRSAVYGRLEQAFGGQSTTTIDTLNYGPDDKSAGNKAIDQVAPAAISETDLQRYAAWGTAFGGWTSQSSDGNAGRSKSSIGGFITGIDAKVYDNWRLGMLAGYSRSTFSVNGRGSSGSSDNYTLGAYAGTEWAAPHGAIAFRTGLAYTWHNIEMSRSVAFPGFSDSLSSDYNAGTFQAFGELGYKINVSPKTIIEPYANLAYVHLKTDGFSETGQNGAGLNVQSDTMDTTFSTLGIRASTEFQLGSIATIARADLGWRHAYGDVIPASRASFAGSSSFGVSGVPIGRDTAIVEAGFDFKLSKNATLGVSYQGQFGSGIRQNGVKALLSVKF